MLEDDIGKILEAALAPGSNVRLKVKLPSLNSVITVIFLFTRDVLSNSVLQMQALQNLLEYLLDAESQMEMEKTGNDAAEYSVEGGNSVPVAAGAGDTNICGGIVQLYWDNILGRCLDFNEEVRQSALKVRSYMCFLYFTRGSNFTTLD